MSRAPGVELGIAELREGYRLGRFTVREVIVVFPTFRFPPVLNGSLAGSRPGAEAPVGSNNYFASLIGFPALSVPMGFVEPGLPIGLQILGRPHAEARLLQIALRYERKVGHRRPPDL